MIAHENRGRHGGISSPPGKTGARAAPTTSSPPSPLFLHAAFTRQAPPFLTPTPVLFSSSPFSPPQNASLSERLGQKRPPRVAVRQFGTSTVRFLPSFSAPQRQGLCRKPTTFFLPPFPPPPPPVPFPGPVLKTWEYHCGLLVHSLWGTAARAVQRGHFFSPVTPLRHSF